MAKYYVSLITVADELSGDIIITFGLENVIAVKFV